MILQSLYQLYGRLSQDPANGLPPAGYSLQNVTFCIVLREDGTVIEFRDLRRTETFTDKKGKEKKILRPLEMILPGQSKSAGPGINPRTLWDNLTYLTGHPQPDKNSTKFEKNQVRAPKCFAGSKKHHESLFGAAGEDACRSAVARYFAQHCPEDLIPFVESLPEDARKGNGVFQLSGETRFVHQTYKPTAPNCEEASGDLGQCLITGQGSPIARLHEPKIKTFDPKGSLLVSFNEKAYESFGKEDGRNVGQGRNAPVSEEAVFAYCNALNWLLAHRRIRIGDASTVFWTAEPTPAETWLPWMLSGTPDAEDETTRKRVEDLLVKISRGTLGNDELGDPETDFFILGLSPNASRLSVRFWHTGTLRELIDKVRLHLNQLEIARQWDETNSKNPEPPHPTIYQLLRQTARDADGIPPLLGGALMRSILLGTRYPDALVNRVMRRIRVVEKKPRGEGTLDNITHVRAAILKAWLMRNHATWLNHNHINMTTALDKDNPSAAYQLGRLFAVYEQAQRAAHDYQLDRTIRETMFSSASANPLSVFGRLDRLNKNHLGKLNPGTNRFFSDLIDEIHQKIKAPSFYPASLNLKEQSLFCIGYYHQRHDLRPKKQDKLQPEPNPA